MLKTLVSGGALALMVVNAAIAQERFAVREATATKGATAQAAAEGTGEELTRFLDGLTTSVEGRLVDAGAGTAIARTELATIIKEQSLADSGLVDRLDPQTAQAFKVAGVSTVVTLSVTEFSLVKESLEVEGRFGKTKAERWNAEASGVGRAYNTTTGALIGSMDFSLIRTRTDEPIAGTQRNASPVTRVISTLTADAAQSLADGLAPKMGGAKRSGEAGAIGHASKSSASAAQDHAPVPLLLLARADAVGLAAGAADEWRSLATAALAANGWAVMLPDEAVLTMAPSEFNQLLASRTSLANLAQTAGARGVCVATLDSWSSDTRTIDDPNTAKAKVTTWTLAGSWRVLDGTGAAVGGGTVTDNKSIQQTETLSVDVNLSHALMQKVAGEIAHACANSRARIAGSGETSIANAVTLSLVAADIGMPDLRLAADGSAVFTTQTLPVMPQGAAVLVDGVAVGNAPGELAISPGLHQIRVEHPLFNPWQQEVKVTAGMSLTATMTLTTAAWDQWRDRTAFMANAKRVEQDRIESALDQATARKVLEMGAEGRLLDARGFAEFLKQSRMTLDTSGVQVFAPDNGGLDLWIDLLNR